MRLYNAKVHSYKAGNPLAKNMTDDEALKYANENAVPMPELKDAHAQAEAAANDQDAIAEQLQQVAAAPVPDLDDGETKTPKKGGARKRKSEPAQAEIATPASPDKKRRRTSGKPAEVTEEPKKSGRKKTKSS